MARENFERALALVLKHEGGYVDHPADPGGATNRGVTRATLAAWRGRPVSKAEVRALTRLEASAIYRKNYWDAVRADELPGGLDLVVFDAAVNSGPARAARWLQATLGLRQDGRVGPATVAAALARPAPESIRAFQARRLAFLPRLPTWPTFGRGWERRVRETEAMALVFAGPPATVPAPRPVTIPSKEKPSMTDSKSLFASKTLWANLVGLAALALGAFGLDTSSVDAPRIGEAAAQLVAAGSFIASTLFRVTATKKLAVTAGY